MALEVSEEIVEKFVRIVKKFRHRILSVFVYNRIWNMEVGGWPKRKYLLYR